MTKDKPTWKNTFNSDLKHWGWFDKAQAAAKEAGYKYYAWNGWVYPVDGIGPGGTESANICLVEELEK